MSRRSQGDPDFTERQIEEHQHERLELIRAAMRLKSKGIAVTR